MKIQGAKYETMRNAMIAVVDYYGGREWLEAVLKLENIRLLVLWRLWNIASDNLRYDDKHLLYRDRDRDRILPQYPGFDVYSDGVNDIHIETARSYELSKRKLASMSSSIKPTDVLKSTL